MLAVCQAVQSLCGQFAQCHQFPPVRSTHNLSVHDIQIIRRHPGQFLGILQNPFPQEQCGLADGKPCRISLSGCISACSKRRHVRILAGYNMYILQGDPQHVRRHLGKCSIRPLADLRLPKLNLQGAILVQHHAAG